MRQHLPGLLAVLMVLVLGLLGYTLLFGTGEDVVLTIVETEGDVTRLDAKGRPLGARVGTQINPNERLSTGQTGHAIIAIDQDSQIRLDHASTVRVLGVDATGVRVELEGGRVHARVRTGSPEVGVNSRGRGAVASDADFDVAVDAEGSLVIDATRGSVDLRGFDGVSEITAGQRVRSMPGRTAVVGEVPTSLLLQVAWPEDRAVRHKEVPIEGRTEPFAQVVIRDAEESVTRRVRAGPDGRFEATMELDEGDNRIQVEVSDPMGNHQRAEHAIRRDSTAPTVTSTEVQFGP